MIYVTHLIKGCVEIQMYTIIKSLVQILISFLPLVIRRKKKKKKKGKRSATTFTTLLEISLN